MRRRRRAWRRAHTHNTCIRTHALANSGFCCCRPGRQKLMPTITDVICMKVSTWTAATQITRFRSVGTRPVYSGLMRCFIWVVHMHLASVYAPIFIYLCVWSGPRKPADKLNKRTLLVESVACKNVKFAFGGRCMCWGYRSGLWMEFISDGIS
jgi:hypothetical protein